MPTVSKTRKRQKRSSASETTSGRTQRLREVGSRVTNPVISPWRYLWAFIVQVVSSFFKNKGLLLAGAVAYNTLLSMIPLLLISLIFLSHLIDEARLVAIISQELKLVVPGQADDLVGALLSFLENRDVIGVVGVAVLLFLSSIAFRMVEDSMNMIFKSPSKKEQRRFWVSALIPYAYMVAIGLGLLLLTAFTAVLQMVAGSGPVVMFGQHYSFAEANSFFLYMAGWSSLVLLFTSIYKILPQHPVSTRRALAGGLTAAFLWEVVRRILTWYFANISLVNVVYGSFATVIVVLLTMEVGAVILLLGAEVIAELEHNAALGLPWYGRVEERLATNAAASAPEPAPPGPSLAESPDPELEKPPDDPPTVDEPDAGEADADGEPVEPDEPAASQG
jgi:membrane protein